MSRTDELRDSGAGEQVAGGGGEKHPWLRWGDNHMYVEGVLTKTWSSKYGKIAVLQVEDATDGLTVSPGASEPDVRLEAGMEINVPVYYTSLEGLTDGRVGHTVHIAFTGWERSERGSRYRVFEAFDLGPAEGHEQENPEPEPDPEPAPTGGGSGLQDDVPPPDDDRLPF